MSEPQKGDQNKAAGGTVGREFLSAIKRLANGVRSAWQRTGFENNVEFRQLFLVSDIAQARVVISFIALAIGLFIISDYLFFNLSRTFFGLLALRLVLVGFCTYEFIFVKHAKNHQIYDRSIFMLLLVIVTGILIVNATRGQNFLPHIIVIDVAVFVFYLVMPTRFLYQAVPAIAFSAGEVILIALTFRIFMIEGLFTALLSLAFSNIVAALCSLQIHSYRWRIFQNVKERKETDRLAAIGQTAGMIGHDIRNPLQAITSELFLAKQAISNSPQIEFRKAALESIELVEEQTDYISKIVSDLQDFARPLKPEIKEVDLAKVVTSVFQTVHVPDKITLRIDVKGFPHLKTDATMIRRALTNLVTNAIQSMPDGGTLEIVAFQTEDCTTISVRDTGKGIPEEIKPRLFTPLVTTKAKGQGLGLAVVKRLVEALGGSVTFESTVGKGTTFSIILPMAK